MQKSKPRGIRTNESPEFLKFWEIVQKEAAKHKCVFFLDSGEGRDEIINGMEAGDLSGWLIPEKRANQFEAEWEDKKLGDPWFDDWDCYYIFEDWGLNDKGEITIEFNPYEFQGMEDYGRVPNRSFVRQ